MTIKKVKTAKIEFEDTAINISVEVGSNLRKALAEHFDSLYNSPMKFIHCRGFGTCGTCALKIEGKVSPPTTVERWRLNFPPHKASLSQGIRLACQTNALGDIKIKKLNGRWGQGEI